MTHRQQITGIFDEVGIDYGHSDGDSIIAHGCRLRFSLSGRLLEIVGECDHDKGDF